MTKLASPQIDVVARCDCGAVAIAVKGPVLSMFYCGCENCQKVSGGGHSAVVLLPEAAVTVEGPTNAFGRPAASGARFTRWFCPGCGVTVRAASSRAAGLTILPAGLLAGANDWFVPNQLIFASQHPHWDEVDPNLPRHALYREETSR